MIFIAHLRRESTVKHDAPPGPSTASITDQQPRRGDLHGQSFLLNVNYHSFRSTTPHPSRFAVASNVRSTYICPDAV